MGLGRVRVPPEIQIGSHTYKISFNAALRDNNEHGMVNHRLQEIEINSQRPASQRTEALIHELLHVVDMVYCSSQASEEVIGNLAEGLAQALLGLGVDFDWSQIKEKAT